VAYTILLKNTILGTVTDFKNKVKDLLARLGTDDGLRAKTSNRCEICDRSEYKMNKIKFSSFFKLYA